MKPVVKLASEPYKKPLFPPILQWFPVFRGETRAGEILGAFEMLQVILIFYIILMLNLMSSYDITIIYIYLLFFRYQKMIST